MTSDKIIEEWRKAPRLNSFASFFNNTAAGKAGSPDLKEPAPDQHLLQNDLDCLVFWDSHRRLWGHFDRHYFASIPFRLEEECRLGAAILAYGQRVWARSERAATIYTLGAGEGTFVRTLAKLGDGRLKTLCCSPTSGNRDCFYAKRGSGDAHFFHGPFFELTEKRYAEDLELQPFQDGFDVLLEDTTFQMYGSDRENQFAFVAPRIRADGVFVQIEKISHPDLEEYDRREVQKDETFKAKYFLHGQVKAKKREILETMTDCEVCLNKTISALSRHFRYSAATWNSGNFYTIVSSNSKDSLRDFVTMMIRPAIPPEFCYEKLPLTLLHAENGADLVDWSWRDPKSVETTMLERTRTYSKAFA